jgi:hypothetical protein
MRRIIGILAFLVLVGLATERASGQIYIGTPVGGVSIGSSYGYGGYGFGYPGMAYGGYGYGIPAYGYTSYGYGYGYPAYGMYGRGYYPSSAIVGFGGYGYPRYGYGGYGGWGPTGFYRYW